MNRIRELREEKKITQIRLSIELEVSQEMISAYEVGKNYPSIKSLIKLRDIFGVSIDYILGLTDQRTEPIYIGQLNNDEVVVIQTYRKLDTAGRERAKAYMQGYLDCMREKQK